MITSLFPLYYTKLDKMRDSTFLLLFCHFVFTVSLFYKESYSLGLHETSVSINLHMYF